MSGLIIKYKETTGDFDANLENEPWFSLVAEHTWDSETYEGTITLNEGVTELPDYIDGLSCTYFNGYETLTEIEFPDGLTAIKGESSASFLDYLEKLIVPDTIEYLGNGFGSGNSGVEWENPIMDMVLPSGLKREYYENQPEIYVGDFCKTLTLNSTNENGYYEFFFGSSFFTIKDAIYINCPPEEFGEQPHFLEFYFIEAAHQLVTVYVAEEYYDMYDFDTFFSTEQHALIGDIIKYNPGPEPPAKKSSFNLEGMLDVDYMRQI